MSVMQSERMADYFAADFVWPEETSCAFATRLRFVAAALGSIRARRALDVGCGTGEQLTAALARLCPHCEFVGIDSDERTIQYARAQHAALANVQFQTSVSPASSFDAVIASEVLEHVDNPYDFLHFLGRHIHDDGLIVLTTPNGYGCSEWMALLETVLRLTGAWRVLKSVKDYLRPKRAAGPAQGVDTWAISPHVNFFGYKSLKRLFAESGLQVVGTRGRMFLHNFLFTMAIDRAPFLGVINARLGALLPPQLVSDWMFVLRKRRSVIPLYRRTYYEKLKRYLNLKRHKLAG